MTADASLATSDAPPTQLVESESGADVGLLRPAAFLDRDGVINRRRTLLVRRPEDLELLPGAAKAIGRLNQAGYLVLVVTNQPAVGWGYIKDLDAVHERMDELLAAEEAQVDRYYACTHRASEACSCRKPLPGMLEQGAEEFGLHPANCWMVGDKPTDVAAGRAFGCRTVWLTGSRRYPWEFRWDVEADAVVEDLAAAVAQILDTHGVRA